MSIEELEKELEGSDRKMYSQCKYHIQKFVDAQRKLLNLRVAVVNACDWSLQEFRRRLRNIFTSYMYIRNIHYVSFDKQCIYKSFWTSVMGNISNEDVQILFCRRNYGAIVMMDGEDIRKKLKSNGPLLVRCAGRFSFIYVQFEKDQVHFDWQDYYGKILFLEYIYTLYLEEDRHRLETLLLKMVENLVKTTIVTITQIIKKYIKKNVLFTDNMVIISDSALLSVLLSNLYNNAMQDTTIHQNIIFKSSIHFQKVLNFILKNNIIIYANNLPVEFKIIQSLSINQLLQKLCLQSQITDYIHQSLNISGVYGLNDGVWSLNVDTHQNIVQLQLKQKALSDHTDVGFEPAINELFLQHLVEETIGYEFMPTRKSTHKDGTRKMTMREVQPATQIAKCRELSIDFSQRLDMQTINQMDFNILDYNINSTCCIINQILLTRFAKMSFNQDKMCKFISKVGYKYQKFNNPFHNIYHGFTVMHGAYMISQSKKFKTAFDQHIAFVFVISALCHDLNHTGFTNNFEEKTQSKLANRYGDRSILQNHSIAKALKLLTQDQTNFIENMAVLDWKTLRRLLVSSILSTDNKNHTVTIAEFDAFIKTQKPGQIDANSSQKVLGALLHCCDFWGTIKKYEVSRAWTDRVNIQFSCQYTKEIELGVQPTPYFKGLDNIQVVAKNENVFISMIVLPLYKKVNTWLGNYLQCCIKTIECNTRIWKKIEQGVTGKQLQDFIDGQ